MRIEIEYIKCTYWQLNTYKVCIVFFYETEKFGGISSI
jgi:hypothetical protein